MIYDIRPLNSRLCEYSSASASVEVSQGRLRPETCSLAKPSQKTTFWRSTPRKAEALSKGLLLLAFAIPIFFFEGTEDFTTPTELARTYLEAINAPQKEFVPIPGATSQSS